MSAYTYTLEYRPGKNNGNSDLLSRLPLPVTEADNHPDVRLSDPEDIDVYLIGASGLQSRLAEPLSSSSCIIEDLTPELDFERGEKELRTDSFTTNEKADRVWHVIQKERMKRKSTKLEPQRRFTIPDNTPLVQPSQVISGQWEPGLILHACPITEEGRTFFYLNHEKLIAVINPEDGDGAGLASSQGSNQNELPEEELDSMEAREFGEKLCEKTATDWACLLYTSPSPRD